MEMPKGMSLRRTAQSLLTGRTILIWAVTCDFQQCGMCDQQSLRSAFAYAQSDQSLCLSLEYSMTFKSIGVSKLKRRLHRLVWVYMCQNDTLLEITCRGSIILTIHRTVTSQTRQSLFWLHTCDRKRNVRPTTNTRKQPKMYQYFILYKYFSIYFKMISLLVLQPAQNHTLCDQLRLRSP